jgi:hypothetical protein
MTMAAVAMSSANHFRRASASGQPFWNIIGA